MSSKIVMIIPTEKFDVSWNDEFEAVSVTEEDKIDIARFYHRTSAPLYHQPSGGNMEEALYDIERYFDYHSKRSPYKSRYKLFLEASTLVYDKQTQHLVALCLMAGSDTEGHIFNIFVDPSYRRRGLATNMIKRALTVYADEYSHVDLETERGNPARLLYQKLGFVTTGEIE
ncbi:GNAT family N-acetyltransferase [bacterium]|nr:GNAT family N-acetyltransferase [bacterium]